MNKKILSTLLILGALTSSLFAYSSANVKVSDLEYQLNGMIYSDHYYTSNLIFGAATSPLASTPNDQIDMYYGVEMASYRYFGTSSYGSVSKTSIMIDGDKEYASFNFASGMNYRYNASESFEYSLGLTPMLNYYMSIDQTTNSTTDTVNLLYLGGEMSANARWYPNEERPQFAVNAGIETSYARRLPLSGTTDGKDFRCQVQGYVGFTYVFYGSKLIESDQFGPKATMHK